MRIDGLIRRLQQIRKKQGNLRICVLSETDDFFKLDFRPQIDWVSHDPPPGGKEERIVVLAEHHIPIHDEDCECALPPQLRVIDGGKKKDMTSFPDDEGGGGLDAP